MEPVASFRGGRRGLVAGTAANPHVTKDSENGDQRHFQSRIDASLHLPTPAGPTSARDLGSGSTVSPLRHVDVTIAAGEWERRTGSDPRGRRLCTALPARTRPRREQLL